MLDPKDAAMMAVPAYEKINEAAGLLDRMREAHAADCPGCSFDMMLSLAIASLACTGGLVSGRTSSVDDFIGSIEDGSFLTVLKEVREGMRFAQAQHKSIVKQKPNLN